MVVLRGFQISMLVALALYTSTAQAGIPVGFDGTPSVGPSADQSN